MVLEELLAADHGVEVPPLLLGVAIFVVKFVEMGIILTAVDSL